MLKRKKVRKSKDTIEPSNSSEKCNKLLFTEKYDAKSLLAPFEECSPSITTAVLGK